MRRQTKRTGMIFKKEDRQRMLSDNTPFMIREEYSSIRTKLMFTAKREACPVYALTSVHAGEGKTITTINIAASFAQSGKRTLIIDADLRNPSIHKYFGIPRDNGLSEYLAGLQKEMRTHHSDIENLSILSSGQVPPNPAELLMSEQMDAALTQLRTEFDFIFIDTPPIMLVTDATILSERITGHILVVQSAETDSRDLDHVVRLLQDLNANIVGFCLNGVRQLRSSYYNSGNYGYREMRPDEED